MPPGYTGTITNLQIDFVLNTPKNPYLNQATQKNTCQNFPTSKNPEIENFKPQRIFDHPCRLIIPVHLKSTPPGSKITVISDFVLKSSFCVSKSFMCRSCKFRGSDRLLCRLIHLTLFFCFPFNNLMNNNLLFIRHKVAFKYMI